MNQRLKFKIAIYSLLAILVLTALIFWVWFAQGWQRDFQRLGDLKLIQSAMSDYYLKTGTYVLPNCPAGALIGDCLLKKNNGPINNNITDPLNTDIYRYVVGSLGEDFFEVNFALEAGLNNVPAGRYILSKEGVKK